MKKKWVGLTSVWFWTGGAHSKVTVLMDIFFLAGTGLVSIITLRLYMGMPSFFSFAIRVVYFVSSKSFPTFRSSSLLVRTSCSSWPHLQLRHIFLKCMETATKLQSQLKITSHTSCTHSNKWLGNQNLVFSALMREYTSYSAIRQTPLEDVLYFSCCINYILYSQILCSDR